MCSNKVSKKQWLYRWGLKNVLKSSGFISRATEIGEKALVLYVGLPNLLKKQLFYKKTTPGHRRGYRFGV